ncbi:polymorphic toxin type 27 domain-containing protein [Longispora sp. K20-0274]|uniref:polymorphic toxin type 27 domain-containing protein n=1 Tax=Longispora sp. K20-0274 TaxID=3088255 RepID=UPI0039999B78
MSPRRYSPLLVAAVVAASLLVAPPVAEAAPKKGGRPHPGPVWRPRELPQPDSTHPLGHAPTGTSGRTVPAPSETPAAPVWPASSTVDIDLGPRPAATTRSRPPEDDPSGPVRVSTTAGVSRVRVAVAEHHAAVAAGVNGVVLSVNRSDGGTDAAPVDVTVDYRPFETAFGGNFADRLGLVALPGCALTTPAVPACRVPTPVIFTHDRARHTLTAAVTLPAVPKTQLSAPPAMVLAVAGGSTGVNGSYAATPLKASDTWSAGGNSGSFGYQHPLTVPPALGGASPPVGLSYDSAAVDGRTTVSNAQPSVLGEGWELSGAPYIETAYQPCARVNPTGWASSGDMCVGTPNASISGGAHAGQLVRDDADPSKWRLANDDGSRVQLLYGTTGGSNNTNDQAYWKVTATDGTAYFYGANRLPAAYGGTGADSPTYSTWTTPVFGTGSGTPCNDPTGSTAAQDCRRAWRWNLDFVIDPHGNLIRYDYSREEDFYQHKDAVAEFTRSGFLTGVDYGWQTCDLVGSGCAGRTATTKPADVIAFDYAPRCLSGTSGCPTAPVTVSGGIATTGITKTNAAAFPDTPYDQHCDAGSTSCTAYTPTFYATVRLTGVRTAVNNGGTPKTAQPTGTPAGYLAVDSYRFPQAFPPPQDYSTGVSGNHAQLRLEEIDHTGYLTNSDGTTVATDAPPVRMGYTGGLPNRAAASSLYAQAQFFRFRLTEITDELGADTVVGYGQPDNLSCGTAAPPATIANATLCFPQYFSYQGTQTLDWFNKYVVTGVSVVDTTRPVGYAYSTDRTTGYTYLGAPAWHTNDSEQADPAHRTVDQFRGFHQVRTLSGTEAAGHNAKTLVTYFQGMDQDPTTAVTVTDAHGGGYRDDNALAGRAYETQTFADDTSSTPVTDVVTVPVDPTTVVTAAHTRAAGLPVQRAHFSQTAKTVTYQQVSSGGQRRSEVDYTYDNALPTFTGGGGVGGNGRLILTDDKGETDASGTPLGRVAELCAFTAYAINSATVDGAQWTAYPYQSITSTVPAGQPCTTTSQTATTTVSQTQTLYDGLPQGSVTVGDVTTRRAAPALNATWVTRSTAGGYDGYGRAGWTADANGNTTATGFTPANGLLANQTQVTNPKGWKSTTTVDRGRGVTLSAVDVNGRRADSVYDGLGRTTRTWAPDHPMATNPNTPNAKFDYGLYGAAPGARGTLKNPYTGTQVLRDNGTYAASYTILDGFGETAETQSVPLDATPGLISTQVEYDSLGRAYHTAAAHYDPGTNPSGAFVAYGDALPSQTLSTFDGLSRPLSTTQYSLAAAVPGMVTTRAYPGVDRTDVTNPTGGGATSTVTDVRGRTTALWTYHGAAPTGNPSDADVTSYGLAYTATGTTTTVTDATGHNTWTTSTGDLLGRTVTRTDPDTGTTTSTLDNAGLLLQTTDARAKTVSYNYDNLGRRTAAYNAPWSASPAASTQLASWAFDTAPGSDSRPTLGLPVSSTRVVGSAKYVSAVTGYDAGGRPLGTSVTIPSAEGALAGTYTTKNYYTAVNGLLDRTDLPAAGGLAAETVYNQYNPNGLLRGTGGNADYVFDTVYDALGRVTSRTLGDYPYQVVQQNAYDAPTGRVTNTFVDATAGRNSANQAQLNTYAVDYTSYAYNAAGLLTSTATLQNYTVSGSYNPGPSVRDTQCYTYDYASRLTNAWADSGDQTPSATTNLNSPTTRPGGLGSCASSTANNPPTGGIGGPAPYWQSYTFDAVGALTGNRSTIVEHDVTGNTTKDVTRASGYTAGGPHLLSGVTSTGGKSDTFGYDAAGNTTSRAVTSGASQNANQTLTWDAEGHLATVADTVSGKTASFVYDASGGTLIRHDYTTGTATGTATLYLGGTELRLTTSTGKVSGTRYYSYPSAPTIVADSTGTLSYELTNAQGTGGTTMNAATGQITARRYLKPYGDPRGPAPASWLDDHTFLDKSTDAATGLTTVGARTYDAGTGRFLSADPVFQPENPQALGGYAYAGNDPASASDPTGLKSKEEKEAEYVAPGDRAEAKPSGEQGGRESGAGGSGGGRSCGVPRLKLPGVAGACERTGVKVGEGVATAVGSLAALGMLLVGTVEVAADAVVATVATTVVAEVAADVVEEVTDEAGSAGPTHVVLGLNPYSDNLVTWLRSMPPDDGGDPNAINYNGPAYRPPYPSGDGRPTWMVLVANAISDRKTRISVTLDGVKVDNKNYASSPEEALNALLRQGRPLVGKHWSKVYGAGTSWEMALLRLSVLRGARPWSTIDWYWHGEKYTAMTQPADWIGD